MKVAVIIGLVVVSLLGALYKKNPVKLFFKLAFWFIVAWSIGYLIFEAFSG